MSDESTPTKVLERLRDRLAEHARLTLKLTEHLEALEFRLERELAEHAQTRALTRVLQDENAALRAELAKLGRG